MTLSSVSITSDKDYLKIHDDGLITISANGTPDADSTFPADPNPPFGKAGSTTITHNLGTVPLVRAFWDPAKNGRWYNAFVFPAGVQIDPWLKFIATTSTLKLIMNTNGAAKTNIPVFYRIYDFGNKAVDSDSRIDKVFLKSVANATLGAAPSSAAPVQTTVAISHGAGEVPNWTLEFSEDQTNWYSEGSQIVGPFDTASGPPGGPYVRFFYTSAFAMMDTTNINITFESNYGSGKTIYVRFALDYRA